MLLIIFSFAVSVFEVIFVFSSSLWNLHEVFLLFRLLMFCCFVLHTHPYRHTRRKQVHYVVNQTRNFVEQLERNFNLISLVRIVFEWIRWLFLVTCYDLSTSETRKSSKSSTWLKIVSDYTHAAKRFRTVGWNNKKPRALWNLFSTDGYNFST